MRDLIVEDRRRGRTIFFSTHILNDVESLCDRVAILRNGEVVVSGRIADLLRRDARRTEVTLAGDYAALLATFAGEGLVTKEVGGMLLVQAEGAERLRSILERALAADLSVEQVVPRHETLEDLFMREAIAKGEAS